MVVLERMERKNQGNLSCHPDLLMMIWNQEFQAIKWFHVTKDNHLQTIRDLVTVYK